MRWLLACLLVLELEASCTLELMLVRELVGKIAFVHILIFLSSFINLFDSCQKVASCNN